MCILQIYEGNRLIKESTIKYFFINREANAIEFQRTNEKKYMFFDSADVTYEEGFCIVAVYRKSKKSKNTKH